jgi:poly-beta-hydroxyalkanoate depolymerase
MQNHIHVLRDLIGSNDSNRIPQVQMHLRSFMNEISSTGDEKDVSQSFQAIYLALARLPKEYWLAKDNNAEFESWYFSKLLLILSKRKLTLEYQKELIESIRDMFTVLRSESANRYNTLLEALIHLLRGIL